MTNISKDTDTKDTVPHDRDYNMMTKVKWSTETNDTDNRFLKEYDNMHKLMEDRQITDYYEAQRHIQSTMMVDTPVKTVQNRQYICCAQTWNLPNLKIGQAKLGIPSLGANLKIGQAKLGIIYVAQS